MMNSHQPSLRLHRAVVPSLVGFVLAVAATGCDPSSPTESPDESSSEDEFVSAPLPEGPCGEALAAFQREAGLDAEATLLRGSVRLPDLRPLRRAGGAPSEDAGGGDAGARAPRGASFRERPAREVSVTVYRADEKGSAGPAPKEGLADTTTDRAGNWCVAVAESVEATPTLLAAARLSGTGSDGEDATVLRRSVVTQFGNAVTVRSEALTRVLLEKGRLEDLTSAAYLNLLSVAATAVDLLSPVPWEGDESVAESVEKVRRALERDERFEQKLTAVEE